MIGWVAAIILGFAAGTAVGLLVRRERLLYAWLRGEVGGLREDITQARVELRTLSSVQGGDTLDRVEGDDYEIAGNLGRMNALLDQLNGLLKGKPGEGFSAGRPIRMSDEPVIFSGQLDFTSPEELLKFSNLPPISDEEIQAMDWENFFREISAD